MTGINVDFIAPNMMPFISIGPARINSLTVNGALSANGDLDMKNNQIINLGTPASNTDAATKLYVDDAVASGTSVLTQKGDMLIRGATVNEAMHLGTDGQHLVANGTTGLPEWQTIPAVPSVPLTTNGDMLVRGVAANAALPVGADGQVLTVDLATANKVAWKDPSSSSVPLTTKGDMLVRGATVNEALPIGTAGQHLVANGTSGLPEWQDMPNIPNLPVLNENDLYIGAAGGVVSKIPAPMPNQQLISDPFGAPTWDDIPNIPYVPLTAQGQMLYHGDMGSNAALPIGTHGQHLTVSTGLLPEWTDIPEIPSVPLNNNGDMLVRGPLANAAVPVGTSGQVLTVDLTTANKVAWKTPSATALPVTTKGDLISHNGITATVLASDNVNGDVLTVDSTAATGLKWKTPTPAAIPFTTKGDLISYDGAIATVLPSDGVNNDVLSVDLTTATGLAWKTPASVSLPVTTKGDLISHNGTNAAVLPSDNVNGDILTVDSTAATGLSWKTPVPASIPFTAKGDLISYTGSAALVLPSNGVNNDVLAVDTTTATGLAWKTPTAVSLPVTTKGDLITHNGTTAVVLPSSGVTGQVLTVDPAVTDGIKWLAPEVTQTSLNTQLSAYVKNPLTQNVSGDDTYKITNLADPTAPADAATQRYTDMRAVYKLPVRVCNATPVLTGWSVANGRYEIPAMSITVDSINMQDGYDILVTSQTSNTYQNGIFRVSGTGTGTVYLTRRDDYDAASKIHYNDVVSVILGTVYENTTFRMTNAGWDSSNPASLNSSGLPFGQIMALPLTTKGDLVVRNNAATNVRLPVGTDGYVLRSSTAATTGLAYSHVDSLLPLTTKGDLMVRNNAGANVRQPVSGDYYVLTSNISTATGLSYTPMYSMLSDHVDMYSTNVIWPSSVYSTTAGGSTGVSAQFTYIRIGTMCLGHFDDVSGYSKAVNILSNANTSIPRSGTKTVYQVVHISGDGESTGMISISSAGVVRIAPENPGTFPNLYNVLLRNTSFVYSTS